MTYTGQMNHDPSARELEILALIADGLSHEEVGRRLYLATSTIDSHVKRLRLKLGARTAAQAVAIAMRGGYLPVDSCTNSAPSIRRRT